MCVCIHIHIHIRYIYINIYVYICIPIYGLDLSLHALTSCLLDGAGGREARKCKTIL